MTPASNEVIEAAQQHAQGILSGALTPYEGGRLIWKECQLKLEAGDNRLDPFAYWASEYENTRSIRRRALCYKALRKAASLLVQHGTALPTSSTALPSKRIFWGTWIAFLATFPAGMFAGCLMAQGQDAAGRGIGIGLGMLGVGLLGGIVTAVFVSRSTVRLFPHTTGRLFACLPWAVLTSFWWMALFTPTGDRLFEWLENL